jgi:hypothetical protein
MPGLAGVMDDSSHVVFDLAELTSMLIIPHLRKISSTLEIAERSNEQYAENKTEDDSNNLFVSVSQFILMDVTGSRELWQNMVNPMYRQLSLMKCY